MCTQRMSIAAGNIFYGLAILFFLLHLYQRHQAGETFTVPKDCKRYFLVYGLYALLLLPSVFFSVDPGRSLSKFADYFIGRIWVLPFASLGVLLLVTLIQGLLLGWIMRKSGHVLAPALYRAVAAWLLLI